MFNCIVVFYMFFTGSSNGLCTLVGNALGARRNADVPPLLRAALAVSGATALGVALAYELLKGYVACAFTTDAHVRDVVRQSSLGVVLSVPLYALLMTFYGALRGANRQRAGILGTVVGYWLVGLWVGAALGCGAHWPTPLVGVWLGNVAALAIAAAWVLSAVFGRIDWLTVERVATPTPLATPLKDVRDGPAP